MGTGGGLTAPASGSTFADQIDSVFQELKHAQQSRSPIEIVTRNGHIYICVSASARETFEARGLRNLISSTLDLFPMRLIQIVGDSCVNFTPEGCDRALRLLGTRTTPDVVLEYGLTSQGQDSAWIVGEWLRKNAASSARALGNVVNATTGALRAGWTASSLTTTFTLLYNADGLPTTFGDDTWLSDGVLDASFNDEVICLEGGVQSFHQVVNVLINNVPVSACTGLRDHGQKFSAARLLLQLKSANSGADRAFTSMLETYLSTCGALSEINKQKIRDDAKRLSTVSSLQQLIMEA